MYLHGDAAMSHYVTQSGTLQCHLVVTGGTTHLVVPLTNDNLIVAA